MRNLVGATSLRELHDAENDLSEFRLLELRENPRLTMPRTYDLSHLASIHRQLFKDVYEWAGDLRTVGVEKDGESFCPPLNIRQAMDHVTVEVGETNSLRAIELSTLPRKVAYLYDYVNYAHPFREGNGRTTREFFNQLLAERRLGLAWDRTDSSELHTACHLARADSDLSGLIVIVDRIIDGTPAYDL